MKCVRGSFVAETEVKRSRFIAHLVPYSVFDGLQKRLKEEHPKANHVAYAYRHINKYGRVVEKSYDDGEPKGCAGVPILNLMRGLELVESAILVVRYFGGIRLGTGGMVRAYSAAARAVTETARLHPWEPESCLIFSAPYARIRQVDYLLERCGLPTGEKMFGEDRVRWRVRGSDERLGVFLKEAERLIETVSLDPSL
jgi:uncharacterized YigZ family protein